MFHQQFGTPSPKSIKGVEHAASTSSLKQAPASQETLAIVQQSYNFQRYKKKMKFLPLIALSMILLSVHQVSGCTSCCGEGWPIFDVNLTSGETVNAPGSGITWAKTLFNPNAQLSCDMQGVLKIVFPQACNHMQKRKLQFDLYFSNSRSGWNFDISDSTNNGYGGDAGHTSNSAEVHNINENLLIYTNTLPGYTDYTTNGLQVETVRSAMTNHITITIGDEYLMFDNNRGVQRTYRSEYLFTLSGQPTTYGVVDYIIYFSMNRIVYPFNSGLRSRTGTGLCRAVIKALDC